VKITLRGRVFSGTGEGRKFIDLPWVKRQIEEKLGFTPYSGTLNIHLSKDNTKEKKLLENAKRLEICPEKGYCTGLLIKAHIESVECAIIIPQFSNYPSGLLEIIAPWYLRGRLKLADGSEATVTVSVRDCKLS
jgi:riboflavin kinase